jgi:hypothetical protein
MTQFADLKAAVADYESARQALADAKTHLIRVEFAIEEQETKLTLAARQRVEQEFGRAVMGDSKAKRPTQDEIALHIKVYLQTELQMTYENRYKSKVTVEEANCAFDIAKAKLGMHHAMMRLGYE